MEESLKTREAITSPKGRKNYVQILDYLSDPENDWITRSEYSTKILGYAKETQIYQTLTPQDLTEIEIEALETRKSRSTRQRAMVRQALFKKAVGYTVKEVKFAMFEGKITDRVVYDKHFPPDPVAAKEFLDRVEGRVPAKVEHKGQLGLSQLTDDQLEQRIHTLLTGLGLDSNQAAIPQKTKSF